MHSVQPKVFLVSAPYIQTSAVRAWLDHIHADDYSPPTEATEAEKLVMLAGKRCYMAFDLNLNKNLTRIRENTADYIRNILDSKHGSVLAHVHYTFAIEGLSRVCTAELNRHRIGVDRDEPDISEGSQRFIRFDDIPWTITASLLSSDSDPRELAELKTLTVCEFENAFIEAQQRYTRLEKLWAKYLSKNFAEKKRITSLLRRIIPMGVASGGLWTFSLRSLYAIFEQRTSPHAEEEILDIALQMLRVMREAEPSFFKGDLTKI